MKTILLFSGGLDSTSLLFKILAENKGIGSEVKCLGINYGQRHKKELLKASQIAMYAGVEYRVMDLTCITPLLTGSSQTDTSVPVPEGRYDEPSMKKTIVPNRNMIMLSIATAWAISSRFHRVAYAAHAGDHAIYPDCRPEFTDALQGAISKCDWETPTLHAPFIHMNKGQCAAIGYMHEAPLHMTWSCYKGLDKHCGRCGACVERREAFQQVGIVDPTEYSA